MSTPGQTVGPFFGYALPYPAGPDLVPPGSAGAIRLQGRVLDGAGEPVPDALVELWQADPAGEPVRAEGSLQRDGWTFTGWGRAATDALGRYAFSTVRPGGDVPFFAITVVARGLLDRLQTRCYLPGGPDDALLASLPDYRRATLVAVAEPGGFRFDIVLQGEAETVFLAHRSGQIVG